MSRYKLIIERQLVTLVDTETGRQETASCRSISSVQIFAYRCTVAGINIETEDRR